MKKNWIILGLLIVFSCGNKKNTITEYITVDPETAADIYWYLIEDAGSNSVSYVTSPKPLTSFTNLNWTTSSTKPQELVNEEPEAEIEAEIDTEVNAEATEGDTDTAGDTDGDGSSDSGSDAGGDSGGGDGGGDGGGE